ncbi:SDR family NAD(P)-dependent oxidoreductase, partial [Pseudomonas syringae pv. actinidiae]|nr:SDR family NAD(P)-dependent oxidoreductase [Pseudomonas syringae pv. actinidiae]
MARRSRMSGDFKLRRTLRNIHQNVDNELRPAMQEAANKILATMKSTIPRDTGEAAGALKAFVSKSGLDAQIGILINNAGMAQSGGFTEQSAEAIERLIALNVVALTRLAAAVAPRFAESGTGSIVNLGSVVGFAPEFGMTVT